MLDTGSVKKPIPADDPAMATETETHQQKSIQQKPIVVEDPDKTRFVKQTPAGSAASSAPAEAISLEGVTIKDRYILETKIGSGGMSDIYRARDLFLEHAGVKENHVAIKVLQQQFVNQPEALQLLLQEAHKTQQLSHPNIVRVFDVDSDQDKYFIVMEYLDGESLDQVIKRYKPKGLTLAATLKLLEQIASALIHAHKVGIVHADLKPANIMVDRAGQVKILDFGVAHRLQLNHDIYAAEQAAHNAPLSGYTPAYASIDLLAGKVPSVADDTFSFACLAYELLTSKHPFDRVPADKAQEQKKQASKPAHLSYPQWLALNKALNFNTSDRNTDINKLLSSLQAKLWKPALLAGIVTVAVLGLSYQIQSQETLVQEVQNEQSQSEQKNRDLMALANASAKDFLAYLPELERHEPIIRAGLLRLQTEKVLGYFERQIDDVITDRQYEYPDYPKIVNLLTQARSLYPDSYFLITLSNDMARSRQTAIDVLRSQLANLLINQKYQPEDEAMDPYKIVQNLHRIDAAYQIKPDRAESDAFAAAFAQASAAQDPVALEQLIDIGNLLFANTEQSQGLIAQGNKLKNAVAAMSAYRQALAKGEAPKFPYAAASLFYQTAFAQLENRLTGSSKADDIDKVYDSLQRYTQLVPADFVPYSQLRKQLADKYLSLGSEQLSARKVKEAARQMRRANELMSNP
ncbi:serine/threonine-protein kinase [Shewanella salipaludis]|uniref:Serine/threonine protein kinase n=1 Tax=Shewanella salipaludis TaxID=2723052 RepID=A0A972FQW6_9GAMM|nr:serine/threonine-protein kinase [Shewanella salipaludis]NMH64106.1 serine/threonine protein kinase [Shewanella salipaludis]